MDSLVLLWTDCGQLTGNRNQRIHSFQVALVDLDLLEVLVHLLLLVNQLYLQVQDHHSIRLVQNLLVLLVPLSGLLVLELLCCLFLQYLQEDLQVHEVLCYLFLPFLLFQLLRVLFHPLVLPFLVLPFVRSLHGHLVILLIQLIQRGLQVQFLLFHLLVHHLLFHLVFLLVMVL